MNPVVKNSIAVGIGVNYQNYYLIKMYYKLKNIAETNNAIFY